MIPTPGSYKANVVDYIILHKYMDCRNSQDINWSSILPFLPWVTYRCIIITSYFSNSLFLRVIKNCKCQKSKVFNFLKKKPLDDENLVNILEICPQYYKTSFQLGLFQAITRKLIEERGWSLTSFSWVLFWVETMGCCLVIVNI